jgi:hypothetical protein
MSFLINPFTFAVAGGDFESIATVTVGSGGSATAVFDNIPGTYQHLQIRLVARSSRSGSNTDSLYVQYNTDTSSANYVRYHALSGNGSSASASAQAAGVAAQNLAAGLTAASASASIFGTAVIDILDYANTSKYKTLRSLGGEDRNGAGGVDLWSGLWMSTSAITKITIGVTGSGANLVEHSTLALYGVMAP